MAEVTEYFSLQRLINIYPQLWRLKKNCQGTTAIEYGLIVSLIGLTIVISLSLVGSDLITVFDAVGGGISGTERCTEVGSNCGK